MLTHFFNRFAQKQKGVRVRREGGLSLVELLVVIAIMTVISGVVLARHGAFNSTALLNNLAYDLALSIRQAQAYGISVRSVDGGNFQRAYGVHFEAGLMNSYAVFQDLDDNQRASDRDGNGVSDGAFDENDIEFVEQYNLRRGHRISNACINNSCFPGLSDLDIAFKRPNPDSIVNGNQNATACITVTDPEGGSSRTVTVLTTGQISIANPGICP